ncbi:MAG: SPOR domain-containing protein [Steroidobacteraceae bacterium]|nr:SPOR domain-containing protein [Steroidobacteraceae bacterium]
MKERLTGAIILVAALVLLVPELLTGPGRSAPVPPADSAGSSDLRSYVIDLAEDGAARTPATAAITEPSVPVAAPEGANSGGTAPDPEGPEGLKPSSTPQADVASEASAPGAETRAVAKAEHASRPQGRTDAVASVSAGTTVASATSEARGAGDAASATSGGSRAEAKAPESGTARAAVPKNAAPAARSESRTASAAAEPGTGWVVQVGSFSSRENAERLARELRGKGFATFVNESPGKGGKHYWRVRVGPERSREAANALRTKLRAAGHAGGSVMSYP